MRYIRTCSLPQDDVKNPNLYPYNSLRSKLAETIIFDSITLFYGNNGSGKSTLLNLLADKLNIKGADKPRNFGKKDYYEQYLNHLAITFEEDEETGWSKIVPENSYYLKSEDVLYEVKKIQQEQVLREGYRYERKRLGLSKKQVMTKQSEEKTDRDIDKLLFAQEKYSNGQTAMQIFEDYLMPDGIYFLDEPEVSLSPKNQLILADIITYHTRFLNCQFVIATHSPFLLGKLEGTIYNLDLPGMQTSKWTTLPAMKEYYDFFSQFGNQFNI